jgi:hypothetical protein
MHAYGVGELNFWMGNPIYKQPSYSWNINRIEQDNLFFFGSFFLVKWKRA